MIIGVCVVPTTPLVLPGLPGRPNPVIAALGAAARRATEGLERADVVLVVAGGLHPAVSGRPDTDLTGYGVVGLDDHDLAAAPAGVVGVLRRALPGAQASGAQAGSGEREVRGGSGAPDPLGPDVAVLARHVPAGASCVGISIPPDVGADVARAMGEAILRVAADAAVAVLVAGDLSAGHGAKPPRPDASTASDTLDGAVIAALDGGRPADLERLDPDLAKASAARAVGALRVLGTVLTGARIGTVVRASGAPLGVGYVVAQGG